MKRSAGHAAPLRLLGGAVLATLVAVLALLWSDDVGATEPTDPGEPVVVTRRITIENRPADERAVPLLLDGLAPATVLRVTAFGFDGHASGHIIQCEEVGVQRCANPIPIQFDERGRAVFHYLITNDAVAGGARCRLANPACTVVLAVGDERVVVDTVFVDRAPPLGTIAVVPDRDIEPGDQVTIRAFGFPPATSLRVLACAVPATSGPRCGAPGVDVELVTGPAGDADVTVALEVAEVGADRVACVRRTPCVLTVVADEVGVRARPIALDFATAPGAGYDRGRVIVGLGVAAAALALAIWLVTRTDWTPHLESAASRIDEAEYADLDREAEEFVEEAPVATAATPSRDPRPM